MYVKAVGRPLTPSATIQAAGTKKTCSSVTCMWYSRMVALVLYIKRNLPLLLHLGTGLHCEQYMHWGASFFKNLNGIEP